MAKTVQAWTITFAGTVIAAGRGGSINRSTAMADVTTEDSNNDGEYEPTRRDTTFSFNGVIDFGSASNEALRTAWRNNTKGTLEVEYPDGATESFIGFLTNFEETGEYEGEPTYNVEFQRTGATTYAAAGS